MGVSGGEEGARKGPSLMPGGKIEAYEILEPILRKIAAHVNGDPTVAYMGVRSAGHFVKNGTQRDRICYHATDLRNL